MKKIVRRMMICMLCLSALFFCACADKGGGGEYDYEIADRVKTDAMIDVAALQSQKAETELVLEMFGLEGRLIKVAPYSEGKVTESFFWVGKPSGEAPKGGWPSVLLIHGGGGNAFSEWVEFWNNKGYVALSLDVGGQMYSEDGDLVRNGSFYCNGSWGSVGCGADEASFKKSWTYMNIAACIAANNYLRSLPYVNSNKIVATGISWGGYLTCILSGLDKRFAAFAPVYGCGNMYADSWGLNVAGLSGLSGEQRSEWAKAYDPTAYLPYATKPMLFASGVGDHAFSSVSHKKSSDLAPAKKFFSYASVLEHGHYWNATPCVEQFFGHVLNKSKPLVNFLSSEYADGVFTVNLEDAADSNLVYTLSADADSHNWTWQKINTPLIKGENKITVPQGATAFFLQGYGGDSDISTASTDLFFTVDLNGVN